jgi:uncharacterized phage protein gp47/JayE
VQFELNETIKIMFVHWAYGQWLDLHAQMEGLTRRAANKATGTVTVIGKAGLTGPLGFQFATPANPSGQLAVTGKTAAGTGSVILFPIIH